MPWPGNNFPGPICLGIEPAPLLYIYGIDHDISQTGKTSYSAISRWNRDLRLARLWISDRIGFLWGVLVSRVGGEQVYEE